ncbi:MAG: ABC transporter permease [Candidatus Hepatoplasma vulgare]|nr:MAG: ABC transporter permease [Candidatus Hepatoplasma sp.]
MDTGISSTAALGISTFFAFIAVYTMGSFAGLLSEKSGIVNIALDGKMIIGALVFALLLSNQGFIETFGKATPYVAILIAGLVTAVFSIVFTIPSVYFMSDQVITGTAINLFSVAFSVLMITTVLHSNSISIDITATSASWAGGINTTAIIMLPISILVIVIGWIIINKTHYGLHLRTSGENPYALETAGVSVYKTRVIALTLAGFFTGIGGAMFPIAMSGTFSGTVNGSGFISLAILIIGQWNVIFIFLVSLAFAGLTAVSTMWVTFQNLNDALPYELFNIIPFILPLIILPFIKNSSSPAFAGKPYKKDLR